MNRVIADESSYRSRGLPPFIGVLNSNIKTKQAVCRNPLKPLILIVVIMQLIEKSAVAQAHSTTTRHIQVNTEYTLSTGLRYSLYLTEK